MGQNGRPRIEDKQYETWLYDMGPFLKAGNTLYYAMDKADLLNHVTAIYEKYRLGDWFSQKVDAWRRQPAEMVNSIFYRLIDKVNDKIKNDQPVSEDDMKNVRFFAEKHRTAQPFFVTRTETKETDDATVGKILDDIQTDYDDVGQKANEQMVAVDEPIQNKG